ncbi:hypothetical protein GCM10023310_08140 [Paenibacillus vulneris]|uniref:Phage integrase SAM-like domain-containing protein n=1 Tax=Paenibacillus vulneris TaxID=1133364 RepID=A0ABW3UPZ5_9BACL
MKSNSMNFEEFFTIIKEDIKPDYIAMEKSNWGLFAKWIKETHTNSTPKRVNDKIIKQYVLFMIDEAVKNNGEKLSRGTIGKRLDTIRNVYKYALAKKLVDFNPAEKITLKGVIENRESLEEKYIFVIKFDNDGEFRVSAKSSDEAYRFLRRRLKDNYYPDNIAINKLAKKNFTKG